MAKKPQRPGAVERFKVARGAVSRLGRTVAVLLGAVVGWFLATAGLSGAFGSSVAPVLLPAGLVPLLVAFLVYMNLSGALELGQDGVLLDTRDRRRYVPFADLADAPPYEEVTLGKVLIGVELVLATGERIRVPLGENVFGTDKKVAALSARLRAALAIYREREGGDESAFLRRGERTPDAWLARLRGLGEGANANLRTAPLEAERLWRIVEDPSADAPVRAAAAAALGRELPQEGRARLRIVAEQTAAPKLRIALESVAASDDEALVAALGEVEREAAR
ncbi:MAG: hypothetical protein HY908_30515 [Myxococcales bacterium]|nr:hypothetical protein [Myxococcales bacterium]